MQELASQIRNKPLISLEEKPLATIRRPLFNIQNGQVLAFLINQPQANILVPLDIKHWRKDFVQLEHDYEFHTIDEIVRLSQANSLNNRILGKKVKTESGQFLGYVTDYLVDTRKYFLTSIFIHRKLLGILKVSRKIVSIKSIVEITANWIIVRDSHQIKVNFLKKKTANWENQPA